MCKHLLFILLAVLNVCIASAQDSNIVPPLTWESMAGHQTQARFIRLQGETVILLDTKGNELQVPLNALNEASKEQARRMAAAVPAPAGSPRGTLFHHRNDRYEIFIFGRESWGEVWLLGPDGKRIPGKPILMTSYAARVEGENRHIPHRIKSVKTQPAQEKNRVKWTVNLEEGGEFEYDLILHPDGFEFGYRFDPGEYHQKAVLSHQSRAVIPATATYSVDKQLFFGPRLPEEGVTDADLTRLLSSHRVQLRTPAQRRPQVLEYTNVAPAQYIGKVEEGIVEGQFAPWTLTFTAPDRGGVGSFYIYGAAQPYNGFNLSINKEPHDAPVESFRGRLQFHR